MKEHWLLEPNIIYLNHGSFGATPKAVLAKQSELRARMEADPMVFLVREIESRIDENRRELARFIGVGPEDLAFIPNATAGVNAVLRSLPFKAGDELLVTNHEYNANRNAIDYVGGRTGASVKVVDIPFPLRSADEILDRVLDAVSDRTRLLLIDHVTSQSALIVPIERVVAEMNARGVETLVDGAHAPGMIPLNIKGIGAPYYAANLHKWVCAPKGAGFLYVRADRRDAIRPIAISHGANSPRTDRSRFHLEFDWTGTFDPTAWMSVGESLSFLPTLVPGGWPEIMRRNHALAMQARDILCNALSIDKPAPDALLGSMASVPLPDGAEAELSPLSIDPLQETLFKDFSIEVPVMQWPQVPKRVLRVSAQLYNSPSEYDQLAAALIKLL